MSGSSDEEGQEEGEGEGEEERARHRLGRRGAGVEVRDGLQIYEELGDFAVQILAEKLFREREGGRAKYKGHGAQMLNLESEVRTSDGQRCAVHPMKFWRRSIASLLSPRE